MHAYGYDIIKKASAKITSLLCTVSPLLDELKHIQAKLEAGGLAVPAADFARENTYLAQCTTNIQQGMYKIAVLGACNTGKSTLLNALLGVKVFPVAAFPCTAITTSLVHGASNEVTLYEEGKANPFQVSRDVFLNEFVLSKSDIETMKFHGQIVSRLKHIRYAQGESQASLLSKSIRLIDNAGLEVHIHRPIITSNFIKQADTVLIFVLNATNPFPRHVQDCYKSLLGLRRFENVFFVVNRLDQIPAESIPDLNKNVKRMLRQHFLDESYAFDQDFYERRVFFTNAKQALETRLSDVMYEKDTEISGLPAFERELEKYLTSQEKFSKTLEPSLQILGHVVDRIGEYITQLGTALDQPGQGNMDYSFEKERLDTIQRTLLSSVSLISAIVSGKHSITGGLASQGADGATLLDHIEHTSPQPSGRRSSGTLLTEEPDPLEVWINIDDHLQFVAEILERADIAAQIRTELSEQFKQISRRRADPNLYLAVVGEFSSGKSTFINAVLHQKLLKASVLPTTTTPTRLCYGSELDVTILFKNQDKPFSYLADAAQLWERIVALHPQAEGKKQDIRECIHLITTQDSIASELARVEIQHPSSFLEGVVVIDTPGTNAESEEHALVTYQIIEREADAAVIVIPGPIPLARTLMEFLNDQLRPFLHRCLFVVTQMDKIPAEEQALVIEDMSKRLSKAVNSDQRFVLYESAPYIALQELSEESDIPEELWHWKARFSELEDTIWNRLRQERTLSIAERLARLMTPLFEQIETHLQERLHSYETLQEVLKSETIQDLSSFTTQKRDTYLQKLDEAIAETKWHIDGCLKKHQDRAKEMIYKALLRASDAHVAFVVQGYGPGILDDMTKALAKEIEAFLNKLSNAAERVVQLFDESFAKEYRRLRTLPVPLPPNKQEVVNFEMNVMNTFRAIGANLLARYAGLALDRRKVELWNQLEPQLRAFFSALELRVRTAFDQYIAELRITFYKRTRDYIANYKTLVDRVIRNQQSELKQLNRLQSVVQWDLKEIDRRRKALEQKQQQIAAIVV